MKVASFLVETVVQNKQSQSLLLVGTADGEIKPGMFYRIPLNSALGMAVPIHDVVELSNNQIKIRTDFECPDDYDFIYSMNIGQEIFEIHSTEYLT